ncbi:hypothetical protein CVT25_014581 [Psilocybe cyanescens]|uniref:Uncharacterized protein n=1 Tax=Psilocybe cyanescens TaxID=93625 RepID=A0A409WRE3_PSICY|nr:hypothetical protein CVT25_014581 [Psilocybe cyanescens]
MTISNITFPLELVEAFVEQLAPGSDIIREGEIFETLIACTLASKYFSFPARKRLFSNLVIDRESKYLLQNNTLLSKTRTEEEISRRINSFLDLLERSSDLALMLRSLHIIVDSKRVILQQATNLHFLLRSLSHRAHNLSILRVYSSDWFSWTTIPQEMADGLQGLCRSLPINHLDFICVHDIPPIIASARESPHLRYIDFKDSNFGKIETGIALGSNIWRARSVMPKNLEVLSSLPRDGRYEICHTSDGQTHIVGINITIQLYDDGQPLNRLLYDKRHMYAPLLTTMAIDFGTMGLLRQLAIGLRIGPRYRTEITTDITKVMNTLIDCLYYGNAKSALQEIKVTLDIGRVLYRGTNIFDPVDFGSPKAENRFATGEASAGPIDPRDAEPEVNDESRSSFEEHIRDLITDAIAITVPPIDEVLPPKIHICAKTMH